MVYAVIQWSKTIPSSITLTASVSANLYSDSACTIPLTSVDFGSFDKLDLTYHASAIFYLKYEGSETITTDYLIKSVSLPSGFTIQWKDIVSGSWLNDGVSLNMAFSLGVVRQLQLQIKQTTAQAKGTYSFSFTVQIGV
jgi:hypothetical protein